MYRSRNYKYATIFLVTETGKVYINYVLQKSQHLYQFYFSSITCNWLLPFKHIWQGKAFNCRYSFNAMIWERHTLVYLLNKETELIKKMKQQPEVRNKDCSRNTVSENLIHWLYQENTFFLWIDVKRRTNFLNFVVFLGDSIKQYKKDHSENLHSH